jgi:hypothetical protein
MKCLQVHQERFVAPYNGGVELAGCGGGMSPFAQKPRPTQQHILSLKQRTPEVTECVHIVHEGDGAMSKSDASESVLR